ncbi:MAG: DUF4349 domain-containing protein [Gemmatimonadota bacterium]|nr:DUF4349 domain-containing protein [Gemmatimonadota bacterium]
MWKTTVVAVMVVSFTGCAGGPHAGMMAAEPGSPAGVAGQPADRLVSTRASMRMESEDPSAVAERARDAVDAAAGYVDQSDLASNGRLTMVLRVPARELDTTLEALEAFARLKERRIASRDHTSETVDLEARIHNLIAVRDRLRTYVERAEDVGEVIQMERELMRVQEQIEVLTARLDFLRTSVQMAEISMRVDRPRRLGPLGHVGSGLGWVVKSLFVIG